MKRFVKIILFLLLPVLVMSKPEDQLKNRNSNLSVEDNDTIKMDICLNKALHFNEINPDSSLFYLEIGLPIAQKLNLKLFEAQFLENRGYVLTKIGNYPKALESFMASLEIAENPESEKYTWNLPDGQSPRNARLTKLGYLHLTMGHLYGRTNNIEMQISSYKQFLVIADLLQDAGMKGLANMNLGRAYIVQNKLDSALIFEQTALLQQEGKYKGVVLNYIGKIYEAKGEYNLALDAYRKAIDHSQKENNLDGYTGNALSLSSIFLELNEQDSSLYYSRKAVETSNITKGYWDTAYGYKLISDVFSFMEKADSAYYYLKLATTITDSLNNAEKENLLAYQNLDFDEKIRLRELEEEKATYQNKIKINTLIGSLFTLFVIAYFLYKNNKNKQKANSKLREQKERIQSTLEQLKSTQSQLIQSEKMASLGELTAGIAHEIQNPLNFVNNFSEVSIELIDELKEELKLVKTQYIASQTASQQTDLSNIDEAESILKDLEGNQQKINHHGKRADAIVKGMLEHSRVSSGEKVPTDINSICDEYLRLSYHGLRAKDKTFNAAMETDFDPNLPKINVVPQDIGRVLLNIINNAFYAVKTQDFASPHETEYKPTVIVSTKNLGDRIEISVKDNGNGIPDHIKDKIFQPFFTTKPTGQGTGLGLSLSYDIVKAQGGEIKINTKENEGTEFTIELPL